MCCKTFFTVTGIGALLAGISLRTQSNDRRAREQAEAYVCITERLIDGFSTWSSEWIPLGSNPIDSSQRVEWRVATSADQSKAGFQIVLRCTSAFWRLDAKQPLALILDGRRAERVCRRAEVESAGKKWMLAFCTCCRADLEAICSASKAAFEFGGKCYDLNDQGLANCRELFTRSNRRVANVPVGTGSPQAQN
jgi:hypothetical protein